MTSSNLTVLILTHCEAIHIQRAVESAYRIADDVVVVDSYSTDDTVGIATGVGARVFKHEWVSHAVQLNWAIAHCNIKTEWVLRLDADEYLGEDLVMTLPGAIASAGTEVEGFEVNRRVVFLGREIRHGGRAPLWVPRVWRSGRAHFESRLMDEHLVLANGSLGRLRCSIVDENLNTLTWWIDKHNGYATLEAAEALRRRFISGNADDDSVGLDGQAARKRRVKNRIYGRIPLQLRAWLYFLYRIGLRLGFLDGPSGLLYHSLQGLWYRLLVDGKIHEVLKFTGRQGCSVEEAMLRTLHIGFESSDALLSDRDTPED